MNDEIDLVSSLPDELMHNPQLMYDLQFLDKAVSSLQYVYDEAQDNLGILSILPIDKLRLLCEEKFGEPCKGFNDRAVIYQLIARLTLRWGVLREEELDDDT